MPSSQTIQILAGQVVWAAAQVLVVLTLARQGSLELLGLYTLGLAIYSPACLILGLNMRVIVAIDSNDKLHFLPAMKIRATTALVSLLPTIAFVCLYGNAEDSTVAVLLLLGRFADQGSDLAVGFHQKHGLHNKIGTSLIARGIACGAPFAYFSYLYDSVALGAFASSVLTFVAFAIVDFHGAGKTDGAYQKQSVREFIFLIKDKMQSAPYPFLDSIFLNSLRYAVAIFLSAQALGVLAVVQTLYSPIQLIVSSVGHVYVTKARKLVNSESKLELSKHYRMAIICSLILNFLFILLSLLLPASVLSHIFTTDPYQTKNFLILFALGVVPLPICGFVALTLFAKGSYRLPTVSALIALTSFCIILLSLWLTDVGVEFYHIVLAFAAAGFIRMVIVLKHDREV